MLSIKHHPELFQGRKSKAPYFEGWYFKQVDTEGRMIAFIPGIQKEAGRESAFIQVIYDNPPQSKYFWYPYDSFNCPVDSLNVEIDGSAFSEEKLTVDLKDDQGCRFSGELFYSNTAAVESSLLSPGIMGWYQLVPKMECMHGLVSVNHRVNGRLTVDGEEYLFKDSSGYIEKDWGRSFPEAWIWTQANSFEGNADTSAMLSVARIPWMGSFFTGFLGLVYQDGELHRFATYTGHKITKLSISGDRVEIRISGKKTSIDFLLEKGNTAVLKAPAEGRMNRDIEESTTGRLSFKMTFADGRKAFEGEKSLAGVEVVGDTEILSSGIR